MLSRLRPKLSFANVVSLVALFVALGGTSYAAVQISSDDIQNNTIRSRDVKNNSIRTQDIRNNTIKSRDVRNGSLFRRDFKPGQLPQGATGPQGPRGPAGKDGTDGADGTGGGGGAGNVTVRENSNGLPVTNCEYDPAFDSYSCSAGGSLRASCQPGERATGGGWKGDLSEYDRDGITEDRPDPESRTPTGWQVTATKANGVRGSGQPPANPPPPNFPFSVYVVCEAA